jgi:acyl-CoA thioesterase-1
MRLYLPLSALLLLLAGCNGAPPLTNVPPANQIICCFGDSLVAGKGAGDEANKYHSVLADLLGREVVAIGKSGATTADGLNSCEKIESGDYGIIVVTLGGNDIMQRIDYNQTEKNLEGIFTKLQERGAVVAFTCVLSPLSISRGKKYRQLCERTGVLFVPDILNGILADPSLRADEIHPNADGYRLVAERVAASLRTAGLAE